MTICAICWENLPESPPCAIVPCGHVFHYGCAFKWVYQTELPSEVQEDNRPNRARKCPSCSSHVSAVIRLYGYEEANKLSENSSEQTHAALSKRDRAAIRHARQFNKRNLAALGKMQDLEIKYEQAERMNEILSEQCEEWYSLANSKIIENAALVEENNKLKDGYRILEKTVEFLNDREKKWNREINELETKLKNYNLISYSVKNGEDLIQELARFHSKENEAGLAKMCQTKMDWFFEDCNKENDIPILLQESPKMKKRGKKTRNKRQ